MIIPRALKKGDKLRIVSPAGKIKEEHVLPAVHWLEGEGYQVELGRYVFANHFQFAGTDKQRLEDLQDALSDNDAAAVLCTRGGYGTVRLLDRISFEALKVNPKWLIGFSDITALHCGLHKFGMA